MYIPDHFKPINHEHVFSLIDQNPFATLIAETPDGPFISHLPLITSPSNKEAPKLVGHMSRSNLQWKFLLDNSRAVAIFHGPHAYITPKWYAEYDVPTWNYAVVHIHGRVRLLEEARHLISILKKMSDRFETGKDAWSFGIPSDLSQEGRLSAAIVGFEMDIERIEAKFKLGQNRSISDQKRVHDELLKRGDENSMQVGKWMEQLGLPD